MEPERPTGRRRLLSGLRPTGRLHLGHYAGVLSQAVECQDDHECFFMIADVQALTTHRERPDRMRGSVTDLLLDCLAAGLKPDRWHFVLQSHVPELAELTVYFQLLVKTGELTQNPTVRAEARSLGQGDFDTGLGRVDFGFLGYPIFQTADMLLFSPYPSRPGDSLVVPVGADQAPHVALAQEVARRFNAIYEPIFVEPVPRFSALGSLPRLDGGFGVRETSRNRIRFGEPAAAVSKKIKAMLTDPRREHRHEPGHPDDCPCYAYHKAIGRSDLLPGRYAACTSAKAHCDGCKESLTNVIGSFLDSVQERRAELELQPELIESLLADGTRVARGLARQTMKAVRASMNLTYPSLMREEHP